MKNTIITILVIVVMFLVNTLLIYEPSCDQQVTYDLPPIQLEDIIDTSVDRTPEMVL